MPQQFQLVWWVPGLPLIGFLFQALLGKWIVDRLGEARGKWVLGFCGVLPVAGSFVLTLILLNAVSTLPSEAKSAICTLFTWIKVHPLLVPCELLVDPLSIVISLVVTGVGGIIHLYATGYMADDEDYPRFFTYFNLFIVFMLLLVLANNLVLMFVGWEGVGLSSYLLIAFWYKDITNAKSGNKAFIVNRIGDWGFMLGIFLVFFVFGSVSFYASPENGWRSILTEAPGVLGRFAGDTSWGNPVFWIGTLLFVGAMGKSAQGPLYLWLPDAMAGPTPVSALIHAATMVTAGVYMVARCHVLFEMSLAAMLLVACVGAFTAFFAATIAFGQFDIKRVLAYSTVSQLGYMFLACGVGAFSAGIFHIVTHAFFKALLFLGSGAVIIAMAHEQDMRKYGNLRRYLPITFVTMICGWLAISGIIPFAGFWSKDEILAKTFGAANLLGDASYVLWGAGLLTAVLTAAYMTRMMWMTFYQKEERWRRLPETHHVGAGHHELGPNQQPREVGPAMWIPLVLLALGSTLAGLLLSGGGIVIPGWPHVFDRFTEFSIAPTVLAHGQIPHLSLGTEWVLLALSLLGAGLGILLAFRSYSTQPADQELGVRVTGWRKWAGAQWGYDGLMYGLLVERGGRAADVIREWIDEGVIDKLLVNGVARLLAGFGVALRPVQTGFVRGYAFTMLLGIVAIIGWALYAVVRR